MPEMLPTVHSMLPAMAVMALPAFLICATIAIIAYRKRN
jgi:hypothetical protein